MCLAKQTCSWALRARRASIGTWSLTAALDLSLKTLALFSCVSHVWFEMQVCMSELPWLNSYLPVYLYECNACNLCTCRLNSKDSFTMGSKLSKINTASRGGPKQAQSENLYKMQVSEACKPVTTHDTLQRSIATSKQLANSIGLFGETSCIKHL